jgi:hypothetical protein
MIEFNISRAYNHNLYHHIKLPYAQYASVYIETQMGENHKMISYIYQEYIHRKNQLTNSPTPIGRRHQHEGSPNSLISPKPTVRRLRCTNTYLKEAPTP